MEIAQVLVYEPLYIFFIKLGIAERIFIYVGKILSSTIPK